MLLFWDVFSLPMMQVMFPFSVLSVSLEYVIFYMGLRSVFDKSLWNFSSEPGTVPDDFKHTCHPYQPQ